MLLSESGANFEFLEYIRWHKIQGLFSQFSFSFNDLINILSVKGNHYTNTYLLGFMLLHGAIINPEILNQASIYELLEMLNGTLDILLEDEVNPEQNPSVQAINTLIAT